MKKRLADFSVNALAITTLCVSASCAAGVPSKLFSINGATIGVTTIDGIKKTYGTAESLKLGQGESADIAVCYVYSSSKGKSYLMVATGPMGGFERITTFRTSTVPPASKCATTTVDLSVLTTGNGVRLGQTVEDFKKANTVEFKQRDSELIYEAITKRTATEEELKRLRERQPNEKQDYFDVTTIIKAKFQDNRLVDLYVHKIESF